MKKIMFILALISLNLTSFSWAAEAAPAQPSKPEKGPLDTVPLNLDPVFKLTDDKDTAGLEVFLNSFSSPDLYPDDQKDAVRNFNTSIAGLNLEEILKSKKRSIRMPKCVADKIIENIQQGFDYAECPLCATEGFTKNRCSNALCSKICDDCFKKQYNTKKSDCPFCRAQYPRKEESAVDQKEKKINAKIEEKEAEIALTREAIVIAQKDTMQDPTIHNQLLNPAMQALLNNLKISMGELRDLQGAKNVIIAARKNTDPFNVHVPATKEEITLATILYLLQQPQFRLLNVFKLFFIQLYENKKNAQSALDYDPNNDQPSRTVLMKKTKWEFNNLLQKFNLPKDAIDALWNLIQAATSSSIIFEKYLSGDIEDSAQTLAIAHEKQQCDINDLATIIHILLNEKQQAIETTRSLLAKKINDADREKNEKASRTLKMADTPLIIRMLTLNPINYKDSALKTHLDLLRSTLSKQQKTEVPQNTWEKALQIGLSSENFETYYKNLNGVLQKQGPVSVKELFNKGMKAFDVGAYLDALQ